MPNVTVHSFKKLSDKEIAYAAGILAFVNDSISVVPNGELKIYPYCNVYRDPNKLFFENVELNHNLQTEPDASILIANEQYAGKSKELLTKFKWPVLVLFIQNNDYIGGQVVFPNGQIYAGATPIWWLRLSPKISESRIGGLIKSLPTKLEFVKGKSGGFFRKYHINPNKKELKQIFHKFATKFLGQDPGKFFIKAMRNGIVEKQNLASRIADTVKKARALLDPTKRLKMESGETTFFPNLDVIPNLGFVNGFLICKDVIKDEKDAAKASKPARLAGLQSLLKQAIRIFSGKKDDGLKIEIPLEGVDPKRALEETNIGLKSYVLTSLDVLLDTVHPSPFLTHIDMITVPPVSESKKEFEKFSPHIVFANLMTDFGQEIKNYIKNSEFYKGGKTKSGQEDKKRPSVQKLIDVTQKLVDIVGKEERGEKLSDADNQLKRTWLGYIEKDSNTGKQKIVQGRLNNWLRSKDFSPNLSTPILGRRLKQLLKSLKEQKMYIESDEKPPILELGEKTREIKNVKEGQNFKVVKDKKGNIHYELNEMRYPEIERMFRKLYDNGNGDTWLAAVKDEMKRLLKEKAKGLGIKEGTDEWKNLRLNLVTIDDNTSTGATLFYTAQMTEFLHQNARYELGMLEKRPKWEGFFLNADEKFDKLKRILWENKRNLSEKRVAEIVNAFRRQIKPKPAIKPGKYNIDAGREGLKIKRAIKCRLDIPPDKDGKTHIEYANPNIVIAMHEWSGQKDEAVKAANKFEFSFSKKVKLVES